jgi:hypothetical protein
MRRPVWTAVILALAVNGCALAAAVLLRDIWIALVCLDLMAFLGYASYVRLRLKRKLRYPLVPPEGKPDMYVPRTDIPRPVTEDYRKLEEKKRKFAGIRKMISKRVARKKR